MRILELGALVAIALLLVCGNSHGAAVPGHIVIDGQLEDWTGIPALVEDQPAHTPGFSAIALTHDDDSIFIRLDLNASINYQSLGQSTLTFYFDADGNLDTGSRAGPLPGAELAIELSPLIKQRPGRPRQGARLLIFDGQSRTPTTASAYDIGLMGAPTYSADRFEFRLARGPLTGSKLTLFTGKRLRGRLVHSVSPSHILQQSKVFQYRLSGPSPSRTVSAQQIEAQLIRNDPEVMRVISWNIADHNFLERFDTFSRILAALDADVLLLDEAPGDISRDSVLKLITAMGSSIEASAWNIQIGQGGGRQRGVIASHLPFKPLAEFDPLLYSPASVRFVQSQGTPSMVRDLSHMGREGMPILAVSLDWAGRELLLAAMDFQCCGFDGSPEDEFRRLQASAVRRALTRRIAHSGTPQALILGGDLNLVGSRKPLDELLHSADLDGSDLLSANPLQLDQTTTATYGFRGSFTPGQLDFMLYSDSSLHLVRSFVFDSRDLPESLAARLKVKRDDSTLSSDHMPIVADFRFRSIKTAP